MARQKRSLLNSSAAQQIGLSVLGNLDKIVEFGAFAGLILTYSDLEQGNLRLAIPQATIDLLLLKSKTEVGVAAALGHVGIRALLVWGADAFTTQEGSRGAYLDKIAPKLNKPGFLERLPSDGA